MADYVWHLKTCELFADLSAEQIRRLEVVSRLRRFKARETVYLPTETADSVFLLVSGLVKICHLTPDGKQSTLALVRQGELFGELALLDALQRDEFVEALEPSTVVMIPSDVLLDVMSQASIVGTQITKLVGLRQRRIQRRLQHLLFLSNHDRLVHLLLDLSEQFGIVTTAGVELQVKLSHQELANLIGSTRETVTIILGQLKDEKMLEVTRRRIVLLDREAMALSVQRLPSNINSSRGHQ
ncbi:MAG: Crp/Fnr family transcriptional regulator [Pirellulaceae bacterium]